MTGGIRVAGAPLKITQASAGGIRVLSLAGEIDADNADLLRRALPTGRSGGWRSSGNRSPGRPYGCRDHSR
ncbi:hypothetical protein ABZ341_40290 [Streptomyces sp. NPDC006173]|uniref:hypothetical protein n=1 Tax=Streptomyces sp. NPDC006173 TaxID=3155349 RepID=UPI0033C8FABF